MFTSVFI